MLTSNMVSIEKFIPVMAKLKREVATKYTGRIIYITVSGSHLYGFPSVDSDVDYRGCFIAHSNFLLGLNKPCKMLVTMKVPDVVLMELGQELNLALKGNCNILEHWFSTPVFQHWNYKYLKELIEDIIGKDGVYHSYRGMATFNYKKFLLGGKTTYKKYLYVFRALMAGTYFLEVGHIEPNINKLNQHFKIKEVKELVKAKISGQELDLAIDVNSGRLDEIITVLFHRIDRAYEKSHLPHKPDNKDVKLVNSTLLDFRKEMLN